MAPLQFAARIVQRVPRPLVIAALAVGLATAPAAPTTAHAGPLNPLPGPSILPDLVVAEVHPLLPYQPGDESPFNVVVKNQGAGTATGVRAVITVPNGFTNVKIGGGQSCTASGRTVRCAAANLAGGDTKTWQFHVTAPATTGAYAVTVTVDPDNLVKEKSETNNTGTGTLIVY